MVRHPYSVQTQLSTEAKAIWRSMQQQETNLLANLTTNDARDNSKDFQNSKVGAAATSRDEGCNCPIIGEIVISCYWLFEIPPLISE
ncbi:chromosome 18 open reading frame 2, isoform CRA_a [Homo sapiens]|uniref:Putative uncharacterized protein encoded by LINC00470 n=2 Tax=Homo sapiens TaxID=9606 RepID=CR002_HUMAN|nr:RecName: Full=Putative uncharacterized protein encoded by LINC00470 [Homo sapiens]AAK13320.1 putative C18orf2 variant 2 [Homo sapiens]EAX01703.1 chromosome 18 open reading frame 2, isoform CRA_a [Homo sapiens]